MKPFYKTEEFKITLVISVVIFSGVIVESICKLLGV